MNKFDWVQEECREYLPTELEHVEHKRVYRATQNIETLTKEDFLPYSIEYPEKVKLFRSINAKKRGVFGVSLFTDLESLKKTVKKSEALKEKTKSYSVGFTTIVRGISTEEEDNHHVDYYLYDYDNNNPSSDFKICEVIE